MATEGCAGRQEWGWNATRNQPGTSVLPYSRNTVKNVAEFCHGTAQPVGGARRWLEESMQPSQRRLPRNSPGSVLGIRKLQEEVPHSTCCRGARWPLCRALTGCGARCAMRCTHTPQVFDAHMQVLSSNIPLLRNSLPHLQASTEAPRAGCVRAICRASTGTTAAEYKWVCARHPQTSPTSPAFHLPLPIPNTPRTQSRQWHRPSTAARSNALRFQHPPRNPTRTLYILKEGVKTNVWQDVPPRSIEHEPS